MGKVCVQLRVFPYFYYNTKIITIIEEMLSVFLLLPFCSQISEILLFICYFINYTVCSILTPTIIDTWPPSFKFQNGKSVRVSQETSINIALPHNLYKRKWLANIPHLWRKLNTWDKYYQHWSCSSNRIIPFIQFRVSIRSERCIFIFARVPAEWFRQSEALKIRSCPGSLPDCSHEKLPLINGQQLCYGSA